MKGKATVPAKQDATKEALDTTAHGLNCPNCDDGTLTKRLAADVDLFRDRNGKTHNRGMTATYAYACDSCDHIEEVVRDE